MADKLIDCITEYAMHHPYFLSNNVITVIFNEEETIVPAAWKSKEYNNNKDFPFFIDDRNNMSEVVKIDYHHLEDEIIPVAPAQTSFVEKYKNRERQSENRCIN
jgi:hypothetical protein